MRVPVFRYGGSAARIGQSRFRMRAGWAEAKAAFSHVRRAGGSPARAAGSFGYPACSGQGLRALVPGGLLDSADGPASEAGGASAVIANRNGAGWAMAL